MASQGVGWCTGAPAGPSPEQEGGRSELQDIRPLSSQGPLFTASVSC